MATRRRPFSGKPITPPPLPTSAPAAPINTVPTGQTTTVDTAKQFSQATGNPITVGDVDSPVLTVVLSVSTLAGILEVLPNTGVVISDNKTPRVTLTGSPANINKAMNGMWYIPYVGFGGVATITMRSSDGVRVDTDTFGVTVTGAAPPPPPAGAPPQNNIPGPQSVQTTNTLTFTGANTFSIADSDSTALTTTVLVSNGRATVATGGGANIQGNNTAAVVISGTVAQINAALAGMTFVANTGFIGQASIQMQTSDGVSVDTDTVLINVTSAAAPPPSPGPSTPPFYPWGSRLDHVNGKYPFGSVVNNRTNASMDADLVTKYNAWKNARVYNVPTISGAKAVKFTDAPYPNTTNALTVSEGIGYGMILAAYFHDQSAFDGFLRLARARPAYSIPTNRNGAHLYLMDWKLGPNGESSNTYGGGWNAVDGDLDIAYALCLAWRQWGTTGTTYNYEQEAKNTIGAIKNWNFKADGTIWSSGAGDVSRLSDYMYGHFRAFKAITANDTFWDTAITRCKAITDKCQTVFSAANGGPACFVPDAVVNTDGTRSGQTIPTNNVTNFGAAFGVSGTYGSGTTNYVPSPGGMLDFVPTEMHHYANSQRAPFRWAADVIYSGDATVKEQCNRINRFIPGFLANDPARCPIGFRLNGALLGPQGGGISMGMAWPGRGPNQGFMNAAQADPAYQSWLNAEYAWMLANWTTSYYDSELMLMGMIMASGNWWTYPGGGGGGGGVVNPNAPVVTVPGAQSTAVSTAKTFSSGNGNQISVTDPNSANLTVVVSALHGTLKAVVNAGGSTLADGFPAKLVYGYWPAYGGQRLTAVSQSYNVISLFAARPPGNNVGDGSMSWSWPGWPTAAEVQEVRARGQKVMLSIGGANYGYLYNTRTKSTNLVNSLISIINAFGGVDGIDYNHYEAGITDASTQSVHATEMIWIAQQLKAQYGANFGITSPPQPNSTVDQFMMDALNDAGCLTWCNPQYYDWNGFKAVGFISGLSGGQNRNRDWVNLLGQTRVAVGLSNGTYSPSTSLTLAESNREVDAVLASYPNERGVSCWNTEIDQSAGNQFANNFKAKFGSSTTGGQGGATVTSNDSSSVTISGTIANVNAALNGLIYTPTTSYTGSETITVNASDGTYTDQETIAMTVGTSSPPPGPVPPPPPPPSGSTGLDVLEAKFGAGDTGTWLDPTPVSRFQTLFSGGQDLTAYGATGTSNGLMGRWKDRSGRGHDYTENDQFSRGFAQVEAGGVNPHAYIYDPGPIANAGGINGPFYICVMQSCNNYYGSWLADQVGNAGVNLRLNMDDGGAGAGEIIADVGTGSARVLARCKTGAAAFANLTGKHLLEMWWEGPGNPLRVRVDKGTGSKLGASAGNVSTIAAGAANMTIAGESPAAGNFMTSGHYFQIVVLKNGCPTSEERDLIATFAASRAGVTL